MARYEYLVIHYTNQYTDGNQTVGVVSINGRKLDSENRVLSKASGIDKVMGMKDLKGAYYPHMLWNYLNERGVEGWDIVGMTDHLVIMKRPLP